MFLDPHIFERHAEAFAAWSLEGQVGIVLYTRARAYHDHTIAPCEAARSELGFAIGGDQDGIGRCRREADEGVCIGCEHRSEEHTSELQSLMSTSYAVFCL